jgi:hypothetical protein
MKNTHLIEGNTMPDNYLRFLDHYNSWSMEHLRWKNEGLEYSWRSKIEYPQEFDQEVIQTFHKIKKRHANYLERLDR